MNIVRDQKKLKRSTWRRYRGWTPQIHCSDRHKVHHSANNEHERYCYESETSAGKTSDTRAAQPRRKAQLCSEPFGEGVLMHGGDKGLGPRRQSRGMRNGSPGKPGRRGLSPHVALILLFTYSMRQSENSCSNVHDLLPFSPSPVQAIHLQVPHT